MRKLLSIVVFLLALAALPASASASISGTNAFTGSSLVNPNDWNDPANWSQGEVPDGADDAVIPSGRVVNLSSGASGVVKTLSLSGSLTIDAGGVAGGRSLTIGSGTSSISSGSLSVFNGAVLNLGSTTNWSSGAVGLGGTGGASVNIGAGEVLNISGDVAASNWGGGLWTNQGTINRTTTSGLATLNNAVENDGAINVSSGTLSLNQGDGSGTSSGTYTAAAGATLDFFGGTHDIAGAGAGVGGAGTVEINGATVNVGAGSTFNPNALNFTGSGTLQLDTAGSAGSLTASGGTRSGSGTLNVTGAMNVNGPLFILKGAGTTTVGGTTTISGGTFNVLDGHTLNLGTTTNWSGGQVGVGGTGGATLNIGAADVLNVTGDIYAGDFGSGLWHNQGTINRTTSSGTARFVTAVENDGTINANTGTLSLEEGDGVGTSSGHYTAAAGATLSFSGGTHEITGAGASLGGSGTVRVSSGTVVVGAGATFDPSALSLPGGTLQLDTAGSAGSLTAAGAGTRSGSGTLTVTGPMSVSSVLSLQGSGTTTVGGTTTLNGTALNVLDGHTLNLGPTTNWSAGIVGVGGTGSATVNIGPSDVLNVTGDVNSQGSGGGLWNNQGTINRATSSGTATFFKPVTSSGTINVDTGTLTFDSGLTQTAGLTKVGTGATLGGAVALQGGTLKGTGTASGSVTNSGGTVAPGASPGKLSIGGNYTQGSGGTLQVEVDGTTQGTDYDWLAVGGSASLDGTLAIVNGASFDPALTDTFDVLTSTGALSGTFAAVTGASVGGKTYAPHYTTGSPGKVRLALDPGLPAAPTNTGAPSIPASGTQGDALVCTPGTWTGSPSFTFQWLRDGVPIPGATSDTYTLTAGDVGKSIVCRVTASNAGGSASDDSNAMVPSAPPSPPSSDPPPSSPPPADPPSSSGPDQTVRGDAAFTQGTSNDLYLACTQLDLLLIDVLPSGAHRVSVTGTADLRLAGQTAEILLDGKRIGRAAIGADGSFAATVAAPAPDRRKTARYQARVGTTVSQRLKLERRMVATTLTRSGSSLVLRGRITKPFAKRPASIEVERFLSCRRSEKLALVKVVPDRRGNFAVRIPVPASAKAAIYRALTKVPPRSGASATARTFTLPRAIDL